MIRTILVDDERPALAKLEALLSQYPDYEVCGSFTNAHEALAAAPSLQPMVALLDIAMPELNGVDLAAALHHKLGDQLKIVFITAYDEYALSAFDVWATDYLLKPVGRERFDKMIRRLNALFAGQEGIERAGRSTPAPPPVMVRLFGKLEVSAPGEDLERWRTAKVRELFALFMYRREGIYRDALLETLWPAMQPERALSSLNTCNYFLRRYLNERGGAITLQYKAGYYRIDLGGAACDADIFDAALAQVDVVNEDCLPALLQAAGLYRGRYLEDVKAAWIGLERERYEAAYIRLRERVAAYYLGQKLYDEAVSQAMLALEVNPLHLDSWRIVIAAYEATGDQVRRQRAQQNMRRVYEEQTGSPPPVE